MIRKAEIPAKTSVVGRMDANNVILSLSGAVVLFDMEALSKVFGFVPVKSNFTLSVTEAVLFPEIGYGFLHM